MTASADELRLSREELGRLYPFFVALDPTDRISAHGPALTGLCPGLKRGDPVLKHLGSMRQSTRLRFADLYASPPELLVVQTLPRGHVLRGPLVTSPGCVAFLGSPWFRSLDELAQAGLSLDDLAPHDPLVDFLATLQDRDIALADANALAQRLQAVRMNLQQSLDENLTTRSRLEALVAEVPWGVLVEDEAGRITLANQAFCAMFGVEGGPPALIGEDCAQLAVAAAQAFSDPVAFAASIEACLASPGPVLRETLAMRDGRILERDFIPIRGAPSGTSRMWQYRDVTEIRRAEQELETARRRAEAASRAKDDFLAVMSHEMRTPLAVIVGLSELLLGDIPLEAQRDFLVRLDVNARSLMKLIEGTLDLARLGNSQIELEAKPFDPWRLVDEVGISLGANASSHGLGLEILPQGELPRRVMGDEHRVRQILVNLVGNAIKFTERGEIRIGLSWDQASGVLRVSVADTGRGVPADMLEAIFENFVRVGDDRTGRGKGTGLGLPICRRIARAMGGTLRADSTPNVGSVFTLELPFESIDDGQVPPSGEQRVALLSDRTELREGFGVLLGSLGFGMLPEDMAAADADLVCVDGALGAQAAQARLDGIPTERVLWLPWMGRDTPSWRGMEVADYPVTRSNLERRLRRRWPSEEREGPAAPCSAGNCRSLRVLLVDDDDDGRAVMSALLLRRGHAVTSAPDAPTAMRLLQDDTFDLVLTDFRMPGMSGIEFVRRMRRRELGPAVAEMPAVVISADAIPERRLAALDVGAEAFLPKPLTGDQLDATLGTLFDMRLRALVVDDAADVRMLLRFLLERTGAWTVTEATRGEEALAVVTARGCDVVLLDLGLEDVDGHELLRQIRASKEGAHLPLIVVSGRDEDEARDASLAAGAAAHLVKPVTPTLLLDTLRQVLGAARHKAASQGGSER